MRTLLFTDLVDSTQLAERLGDEAAAPIWAAHDRCARGLLALHRGQEIDRTDGFFLLFDEALDAMRFALAYHRELAGLQLSARVGLHTGTLKLRENTPEDVARGAKPIEFEGLAKPFAARIMSLARGGQTLLSSSTRAAVAVVPEDLELASQGHYRLKGIDAPVELFEIGTKGCVFLPPADSDKAYRVVRDGELWRPLREVRNNLAPERDAFIGRTDELRTLARRLDQGARLLTVLGPGGTGKTRFVRRYARAWLGDWPGGVYFCDLSEARSLEGIFFATAVALGVPLGHEDPGLQLGHVFAGRGRCLVVLDNFEQVLVHAPASLGKWLDRAAEASFIVTSRELLRLPGEEAFPVEPLPLETDAIELFEARARAQRPDFVLGGDNRPAVVEVARLLDGLPLAIELAAARIRIFSPRQIVARMKDRFQLLAGARGAAARQATLKAAIDWSWELLAPWEQAALAQCAVFEGGFTMVAAEAVLDLSAWPQAPPAMDAVHALVDKSLLRTWRQSERSRLDFDEPYFGMYLSIHEYAIDRLARSSEGAELRAQVRHGRYFAGLGTDEGAEGLAHRGAVQRSRELSLEIDNLVVACRRALARGDGDTATASLCAAWSVFDIQGPLSIAAELAPRVVAMPGLSQQARARSLAIQAWVHWRTGRMDEAAAGFEQALQLHGPMAAGADAGDAEPARAQARASRRAAGQILNSLGLLFQERGEHGRARQLWERALDAARDLEDHGLQASVLGNCGLSCWKLGQLPQAREFWEAAVAIHRQVGDVLREGVNLGNLAMLLDERSQVDEALVLYEQALQLHRAVGNRRFEAIVFGNLGCLHATQHRFAQAHENFTAALALFREVGDRRGEGVVLGNLGSLDHDQGRTAQALIGLQTALAIHREVGNRALEGAVLGRLGELWMTQGQAEEARQALTAGEAVLRDLGHRLELSNLLCVRGLLDVAQGRLDAARAALGEAMASATAMDMPEHSELRRAITKLQAALA